MKTYHGEFLTRPELEALGVTCGGDDVRVHVSTVIINPEGLRIGNHVRVDPFCLVSATAKINLGDHIHIASHCSLIGGGGIELEDFSGVSHGARLFSAADDTVGSHMTGPTVPNEFRLRSFGADKSKAACRRGHRRRRFSGRHDRRRRDCGCALLCAGRCSGLVGLGGRPGETN